MSCPFHFKSIWAAGNGLGGKTEERVPNPLEVYLSIR